MEVVGGPAEDVKRVEGGEALLVLDVVEDRGLADADGQGEAQAHGEFSPLVEGVLRRRSQPGERSVPHPSGLAGPHPPPLQHFGLRRLPALVEELAQHLIISSCARRNERLVVARML